MSLLLSRFRRLPASSFADSRSSLVFLVQSSLRSRRRSQTYRCLDFTFNLATLLYSLRHYLFFSISTLFLMHGAWLRSTVLQPSVLLVQVGQATGNLSRFYTKQAREKQRSHYRDQALVSFVKVNRESPSSRRILLRRRLPQISTGRSSSFRSPQNYFHSIKPRPGRTSQYLNLF